MSFPLVVLGVLSLGAGALQNFLLRALGFGHSEADLFVYLVASAIPVVGLCLAYVIYKNTRDAKKSRDFGFDFLYHALIIKPYCKLAHILKNDVFAYIYLYFAKFINLIHQILRQTQSGNIGQYLTVIVASALTIIGFLVWS